jgi:hypothetical protein
MHFESSSDPFSVGVVMHCRLVVGLFFAFFLAGSV